MQLKIEHIAKRLPYGLRVQTADGVFKVVGWSDEIGILLDTTLYGANAIPEYKLVLFPLSALTQEITMNGDTFVPKDRLDEMCLTVLYKAEKLFEIHGVSSAPYAVYRQLLEWHIDTDGLIESNLAISVFDLPENPYK